MRLLYVDTGYFLALALRRDVHHVVAVAHFTALAAGSATLLTTDAVIGETLTRLRYDGGVAPVTIFARSIEAMASGGTLRIEESAPTSRAQAVDLVARYDTRPLSYADALGAVVARRHDVDAVLGFDEDFRMLGFALEPS